MRTRTLHRQARPHAKRSRGVAMLLVLISLMMATILTTSYLASRDNSVVIGQNAASAAAARWAAESALDFGIAVLQTEKNWRSGHSGGRLLSDFPLAGAHVNIDLLDMETNRPPSATTEYVRVTVTGLVNGVEQRAVATARVPVITGPVVDVDLSEFAVFASTRLRMQGDATLTRWPMAPLSALGDRVYIGTRALGASSITLADDSAAVDTTVYHGPGASALLVAVAEGLPPEQVALGDAIPLPAAPSPGVAPPSATTYPTVTHNGGSSLALASMRYHALTMKNGAVRTLRGNISLITDEDLTINSNAKLLVDGDVKIVLFGDLEMHVGSIELRPGARLTMFIRGTHSNAMRVRDGYIGNQRTDSTRDHTGTANYMNPERVVIYSIPAAVARDWTLSDNSVIKGSLYAPDVDRIEVNDESAIYGRVATTNVTLSRNAGLFYDPSLNDRVGFTAPGSLLFDNDGHILDDFAALGSLDPLAIQAAADSAGVLVATPTGVIVPDGWVPADTPAVPGDPTPRPVQVSWHLVSLGDEVTSWE